MNWLRKVAFEECAVAANKTGLVGAPCSSEEGTACSNSPELDRTAHWMLLGSCGTAPVAPSPSMGGL